MNAVEIEAAVSSLAAAPFDAAAFALAFAAAYDQPHASLGRPRIAIRVCDAGAVNEALASLRASAESKRARFILATDGHTLAAEDRSSGETIACAYRALANRFGFFLPLAGIAVIEAIKNDPIDVRATGRLNALYLQLLRDGSSWSGDMNCFLARLVLSLFAQDVGMFGETSGFRREIADTKRDGSNTREAVQRAFRSLNAAFSIAGNDDVPRFSRVSRALLLRASELDWRAINPEIFGSMLQAVADEAERGALGMHYTSVPNILKVLNPLFLDALRAQLHAAGHDARKLRALRERIARIRVFDPACGSGNFLVVAYQQMRAIEAHIDRLRGEPDAPSAIALVNFRGIEKRAFAAQIARIALVIAAFQCGQRHASADAHSGIFCGNALDMDWSRVCPSEDQARGETYVCGNPPYLGGKWQTREHKADLEAIFRDRTTHWKTLDYVAGWFMKAADFRADAAFVATNSVCQGVQVPILWPLIAAAGQEISFAHTSFKWSNLARHNAGVSVVIVGMSARKDAPAVRRLYSRDDAGREIVEEVGRINAYLVAGREVDIRPSKRALSGAAYMDLGNMPKDGGHLLMSVEEADDAIRAEPDIARYVFDFVGAREFVKGVARRCLWIEDGELEHALASPMIAARLAGVRAMRLASAAASTRAFANRPHRFKQIQGRGKVSSIVVPKVTSEARLYLPVGVLSAQSIVSDNAFALYDAPLWNMALIASRLHRVWIATVCGKLESRYRYSNTLGWNTFPVPRLTERDKDDLTRCAQAILHARAAHFPASIARLYDARAMPDDLRRAHAHNDETLERLYIGRCFRNDSERLETLFELYRTMSARVAKRVSSDS